MRRSSLVKILLLFISIIALAAIFIGVNEKLKKKVNMELVPDENYPIALQVDSAHGKEMYYPWYNPWEDMYHFTLPNYYQGATIYLHTLADMDISLDGKEIAADTEIEWNPQLCHTITNSTESFQFAYDVTAGKISTAYIETDHHSKAAMQADKTVIDSGIMRVTDKTGKQQTKAGIEEIHTRGNSTFSRNKQPYAIKFEKTVQIDDSSAKKWKLLALDFETTKLNTYTALEIMNMAGVHGYDQYSMLQVYIDGEYQGLYLITKAIDTDISEGGYCIEKEIDYRAEESETPYFMVGPDCFLLEEPEYMTEEKVQQISRDIGSISDKIARNDSSVFQDIDLHSFAQRYIVEELTFNIDAYKASSYFYKKNRNDLLYADWFWDYDLSLDFAYNRTMRNKSVYDIEAPERRLEWFRQLEQNEEFRAEVTSILEQMMPKLEEYVVIQLPELSDKIGPEEACDRTYRESDPYVMRHYYQQYDSGYRYFCYALIDRISYLAELYGVAYENPEYPWLNADRTVFFHMEDGSVIKVVVPDGSYLEDSQIPKLAEGQDWELVHNGWILDIDKPILEDMELIVCD